MEKPVLGAQLYTVRDSTQTADDLRETLRKVREIGYTAVQLSAVGPIAPDEIAGLVREAGVTVAATHAAWPRFLEDLDGVIREHQMWDCRHTAIGGLPNDYYSEAGVPRFLEELVPVAERLAAAGLDFSYHNHDREFARCGKRTWLAQVFDGADPRHLKAELDTYWIQAGGGDPADWIRRCAGRVPILHVKDMCITPEREVRYAEIGEGNLNWPAILRAAEEGGVEYLVVEQDECYGRDPFESLAISYGNLRRMGYA